MITHFIFLGNNSKHHSIFFRSKKYDCIYIRNINIALCTNTTVSHIEEIMQRNGELDKKICPSLIEKNQHFMPKEKTNSHDRNEPKIASLIVEKAIFIR